VPQVVFDCPPYARTCWLAPSKLLSASFPYEVFIVHLHRCFSLRSSCPIVAFLCLYSFSSASFSPHNRYVPPPGSFKSFIFAVQTLSLENSTEFSSLLREISILYRDVPHLSLSSFDWTLFCLLAVFFDFSPSDSSVAFSTFVPGNSARSPLENLLPIPDVPRLSCHFSFLHLCPAAGGTLDSPPQGCGHGLCIAVRGAAIFFLSRLPIRLFLVGVFLFLPLA